MYEVFEQHGKPVNHTTVAAALGESHQSAVRSALTIARERWREQHPDAMPSSKEALAAVKGLMQQRGSMYFSNKNIHEALLPQLPGLTFGQVRRAAARVRDPQRAVTTYGQEIPVWEASQRAYVFPSTGEHVAGDQWSTPTKGEAGRTMRHHVACGRLNEQANQALLNKAYTGTRCVLASGGSA